jgi:hypothetical protein
MGTDAFCTIDLRISHRFQTGAPLTVSLTTDILPYVLRSGFKPRLQEVLAIAPPKGKKAAEHSNVNFVQADKAWSLTVVIEDEPRALDNGLLLARFSLEQRQQG